MIKRCFSLGPACLWMLGLALAQNTEPSTIEASEESFWGIYLLLPLPFLIIGLIAYLLYRSDAKRHRRKPKWVE